MIIYNCEQHSEAWHEARLGRVTGTRFAALMAGESTKTYRDLISNLACEIITGKAEETYSNAIMEAALEKEPDARKEYELLFGTQIKQCGFIIPDEGHKYHDWIGISPDGLTADSGLIEIKCPFAKTHIDYITRQKLPSEYGYQIYGQLFVTGLNYCDFISYSEGMKLFVIRNYPDNDMFKIFEKQLNKVIKEVENKIEIYNKYRVYD